ncbi:MAG: hypothetical protein K5787_00200 [Lentisphaeria bacterium]|nr:hypothetical protein [Victivallales bacterium]MCR4572165.1 hypothetical protein [Lentisphaeria bacterium]
MTVAMEAIVQEQFFSELAQGASSFLGLPQQGALSILSDLLACIAREVMILEVLNEDSKNRMFVDTLDSLLTVCEKLPMARILRSYVGRIAGASGEQGSEKRKLLLGELKGLLDKAQRRLKRA